MSQNSSAMRGHPFPVQDGKNGMTTGPLSPRSIESRLCLFIVVTMMSWLTIKGLLSCNEWQLKGFPGAHRGWIPNRAQDLSDSQYRSWRSFFPILLGGLFVHVGVGKLLLGCNGVRARPFYAAAIGAAPLVYMHGASSLWLLLILLANFGLSRALGGRSALPLCVWALNCGILFACDYYSGFSFAAISDILTPLDLWRGVLRWHVHFNLTFLRLISFVMDHHWAVCAAQSATARKVDLRPHSPADLDDYEARVSMHLPLSQYSLFHAFAYMFYLPLYIAGPVLPFNAFVSQIYSPQSSFDLRYCVSHLLRVVAYMGGLEIALHYLYYYGLNEGRAWSWPGVMPAWEVALAGFFTLNFMYVKFLTIWRFFRVWALLDGIEAPENMRRCVNNNFTFAGFWRAWHASLNKWIVRYMYVPLGGTRTQAWSVWIIFTFVGLWHDLWWRWVAWAWLNCAFFNAEMIIVAFYRSKRLAAVRGWKWSRHVVALAGALDIFCLMVANLAILHGFQGTREYLSQMFIRDGGLSVFAGAFVLFYSAVLVMQDIRTRELVAAGKPPRF
eukprot:Opistho-2@73771